MDVGVNSINKTAAHLVDIWVDRLASQRFTNLEEKYNSDLRFQQGCSFLSRAVGVSSVGQQGSPFVSMIVVHCQGGDESE